MRNTIKKMFVFLYGLTMGISSYAGTPLPELNNTIQKSVSQQLSKTQQNPALFPVVKAKVEAYYERNNFRDAKHTTGWYRVDRFLKWIKANEKNLQTSHFNFISDSSRTIDYGVGELAAQLAQQGSVSPQTEQAFWVYLGARYTEDIYQVKGDFSSFTISLANDTAHALVKGMFSATNGIVLNATEVLTLPQALNLGIHEGTHLLPALVNNETTSLTELATFYSQYNFGLPVKAAEVQKIAHTTRDVRRFHALRPDLPFKQEYNYFIAGIVLNPQLTPPKILQLKENNYVMEGVGNFPVNMTVQEMAWGLLAARRNQFLFGGGLSPIPVTAETLVETAKLFNVDEKVVQQWLTTPAKIIDIGDFTWPKATYLPKAAVILSRTSASWAFIGGLQRADEAQLLQSVFGEMSEYPPLRTFYSKLLLYLPQDVLGFSNTIWPVVTSYEYMAERPLLPYGFQPGWEQAIIRALDEVTTDSAPIPEGYL